MKICTLIVRLVGITLLVRSLIALIEVSNLRGNMQAMQTKFGGASLSMGGLDMSGQITRMHFYIILGIVAGLVCTVLAPHIARLLTFDAPEDKAVEPTAAPNDGPARSVDNSES